MARLADTPLAAAELAAWDRPGPRYTSYPPIPRWSAQVSPEVVSGAIGRLGAPAELYVHVPFCTAQCSFCGCNMVVAKRRSIGDRYLDAIARQVRRLPLPAPTVPVDRIHLGGGTPTWLDPDQLTRLMRALRHRVQPTDDAELSVEANPDVTTPEHLVRLHALGFRRLSLGVQSFDPTVLAAVGRQQTHGRVQELFGLLDRLGGWRTSLDLMVGLPHQTPERFAETLRQLQALRPDRVSLFGYAHMPHLKRHQKSIDAAALPQAAQRAVLWCQARDALAQAGYRAIGFDHFALPSDPLAAAQVAGRLHRNFMGYTTRAGADLLALGPSAISQVGGVFWQDQPHLGRWLTAVEGGEPTACRGMRLDPEDKARGAIIMDLLCNGQARRPGPGAPGQPDLREAYDQALETLGPMAQAGLVELRPDQISITRRGWPLMRIVAQAFDNPGTDRAKYSRVV